MINLIVDHHLDWRLVAEHGGELKTLLSYFFAYSLPLAYGLQASSCPQSRR